MFKTKWYRMVDEMLDKALSREDVNMHAFFCQISKVPKKIVDHIARCFISACELTYKIAVYEYLVGKKGKTELKDSLTSTRITMLNKK